MYNMLYFLTTRGGRSVTTQCIANHPALLAHTDNTTQADCCAACTRNYRSVEALMEILMVEQKNKKTKTKKRKTKS